MATSTLKKQKPFTMLSLDDKDPFLSYEELRDRKSLVWDEKMKGWLVLSYDTCKYIETNEPLFRHPYADATPELTEIKGGAVNISLLQGDAHARMRKFHLNLLSPAAVESYRVNHVVPLINSLIDKFVARGSADLTAEFGDPLPSRVFASLFGMPWQDDALIARILHLHEEMMLWIGQRNQGEELTARARAASRELNELLTPYIRARRDNPGDDFVSRIWTQGPVEYGDMSEQDVLATCRELLLGGSDTTVHAIANTLYLLLTNDEVRKQVTADRRAALNAFVEESMRLLGSVQYRFRVANQDCELQGTSVRKNELLILLHAAANRDPAHYACPHAIDLTRKPASDHLAFNVGPRSCIGISLARVEIREAVSHIIDRLPNVRLDPRAEQPKFRSLYMRSFRPLHVLFDH